MSRKVGVSGSVNLSKIDKSKLITGKTGDKYLPLSMFIDIDEKDQYDNNGMITQGVSKEDKEAGVKGAILGNTKIFWQTGLDQQAQPQSADFSSDLDDDIGF